jgi:hypothetical protein
MSSIVSGPYYEMINIALRLANLCTSAESSWTEVDRPVASIARASGVIGGAV